MAKAFTASACSSRLTIASPFSWLSASNAVYYHKLGARYSALGVPVEVLALDGENSTASIGRKDPYLASTASGVDFGLVLEDVRIPLGSLLHEFQGRRPRAEVDDGPFQLRSPCLLVGENGQGKSLVAKALAGAVDITGRAGIDASGGGGRIRLLFQDVVTQTLLRTFDDLAAPPSRSGGAACLEVFGRIARHLGEALAACGKAVPCRDENGVRSLLDIKAILIAARLAAPCSALILDEPDWGLTRASAVALVSAAVTTAHGMGVPVILISHKPWWGPIAASSLTAERGAAGPDGSFRIRLSMGRGGGP